MPAPARSPLAAWLHRIVAVGSTAVVLALVLFAASPAAHEWLHASHGSEATDDGCAVVLFASGVSLPLGPLVVPAPHEFPAAAPAAAITELRLVSPRYLRQPERGPPSSWIG